jgi:hypothetical protein
MYETHKTNPEQMRIRIFDFDLIFEASNKVNPKPAMKVAPVETLEPNKQKSSSDAVMAA